MFQSRMPKGNSNWDGTKGLKLVCCAIRFLFRAKYLNETTTGKRSLPWKGAAGQMVEDVRLSVNGKVKVVENMAGLAESPQPIRTFWNAMNKKNWR